MIDTDLPVLNLTFRDINIRKLDLPKLQREVILILGNVGSGKTTLVRDILSGFRKGWAWGNDSFILGSTRVESELTKVGDCLCAHIATESGLLTAFTDTEHEYVLVNMPFELTFDITKVIKLLPLRNKPVIIVHQFLNSNEVSKLMPFLDYTFAFTSKKPEMIKLLFDNFKDDRLFSQVYQICTEDHHCLVRDHRSNGPVQRPHDAVYWYRSKLQDKKDSGQEEASKPSVIYRVRKCEY